MLGKLIKHEFIADSKLMVPAYVVVLVLSLLGRLMTWLSTRQSIEATASIGFVRVLRGMTDIITVLYGLAFVALIIMTIIFMINRFYKNFFTDEGYLMLTLPTKPRNLVFSKLVNYFIWMLFSTIVALGSLWITLSTTEAFRNEASSFWHTLTNTAGFFGVEVRNQLGVPGWSFALELVFLYLVWAVQFALICYFSVAFGQLRAKNHKVLGSVLSFIIFIILGQIIISWYSKFASAHFSHWFATPGGTTQAFVWFDVLLLGIIAALLYWGTCRIMSRKVNLD